MTERKQYRGPVILRFHDGRVLTCRNKTEAAEYVGCTQAALSRSWSHPRLGFDMWPDTPENAAYRKVYTTHKADAMIWPLWYLRKGLAPVSSYADCQVIGRIRRGENTEGNL